MNGTKSTPITRLLSSSKPRSEEDLIKAVSSLRRMVLTEGVPTDSSHRSLIWKIFLSVPSNISAAKYAQLVSYEQSPSYEKIRNDSFRTLATDKAFKQCVTEESLVRLLEAFVWRHSTREASISNLNFNYVQGMNVLAAPFLYVMPSEMEAYYTFAQFVETRCPMYVQPALEGVHRGLKLVDKCLEIIDFELFNYLSSKNLSAQIYAFPSVLTFCACTPPLVQVIQLWDFLLAYGPHMNILCIIAQLWLLRDQLIGHPNPMKLLRTLPPLNAQKCIMLACQFVSDLSEDVYDNLVKHPYEVNYVPI